MVRNVVAATRGAVPYMPCRIRCKMNLIALYTKLDAYWSVIYPICRSVCLSAKCPVAKRLIGSGRHLGWWVGSVEDGCIIWVGDRRREWAVLGVNLGRPIVTNGDFVTRLFPNYFEQYLLWLWLTIAVPWRVQHRFRPFSRRTVILVRLGRPMLACHIFTFYTDNWRHLATKARTDRRIKRLTLTWKRTKMAKIKDFLVV